MLVGQRSLSAIVPVDVAAGFPERRSSSRRRAAGAGARGRVPYDDKVKSAALACGLGLLGGCSATTSNVVVSRAHATEAIVQTAGDLSPGDVVHIRHYSCPGLRRCRRYRWVADGIVTEVIGGVASYAVVRVSPSGSVRDRDRAVKDSPMVYWHPGTACRVSASARREAMP